jgi:hypothetical protein
MALVQCIDAKKHITFGDLATDYCRQLTSCFAKAHTVADVFDRYDVKKNLHGQNPAMKELGKLHFRTVSLDLIYKISSLYHLHGTWTPG